MLVVHNETPNRVLLEGGMDRALEELARDTAEINILFAKQHVYNAGMRAAKSCMGDLQAAVENNTPISVDVIRSRLKMATAGIEDVTYVGPMIDMEAGLEGLFSTIGKIIKAIYKAIAKLIKKIIKFISKILKGIYKFFKNIFKDKKKGSDKTKDKVDEAVAAATKVAEAQAGDVVPEDLQTIYAESIDDIFKTIRIQLAKMPMALYTDGFLEGDTVSLSSIERYFDVLESMYVFTATNLLTESTIMGTLVTTLTEGDTKPKLQLFYGMYIAIANTLYTDGVDKQTVSDKVGSELKNTLFDPSIVFTYLFNPVMMLASKRLRIDALAVEDMNVRATPWLTDEINEALTKHLGEDAKDTYAVPVSFSNDAITYMRIPKLNATDKGMLERVGTLASSSGRVSTINEGDLLKARTDEQIAQDKSAMMSSDDDSPYDLLVVAAYNTSINPLSSNGNMPFASRLLGYHQHLGTWASAINNMYKFFKFQVVTVKLDDLFGADQVERLINTVTIKVGDNPSTVVDQLSAISTKHTQVSIAMEQVVNKSDNAVAAIEKAIKLTDSHLDALGKLSASHSGSDITAKIRLDKALTSIQSFISITSELNKSFSVELKAMHESFSKGVPGELTHELFKYITVYAKTIK